MSAPAQMVAGGKHTVALRLSQCIQAVALPVSFVSIFAVQYFTVYANYNVLPQRAVYKRMGIQLRSTRLHSVPSRVPVMLADAASR